MAGHSQFKNIMHRKGRQDAARAKLFAKLAREITVSVRNGLPDPEMNARLRLAIQAARAENMPKDNIERAIKKAAGADTEVTLDRPSRYVTGNQKGLKHSWEFSNRIGKCLSINAIKRDDLSFLLLQSI